MTTQTSILGFVLCFIAGMGLMYSSQRGQPQPEANSHSTTNAPDHASAPIPVTTADPIWGSPSAPVTLVEFSDLECAYCKRVESALDRVRKQYGPKDLRIVWKHKPLSFHKQAREAALAAQAILHTKGADAFWKFRDRAYQNQQTLGEPAYELWAADLGISVADFRKAASDPSVVSQVDADLALAERLGAGGTPTFFINGRRVVGAARFEQFQSMIDAELAEAKRLAAAGTAPGDIYPKRLAANASEIAKPAPKVQAPKAPVPKLDETLHYVPISSTDFMRGPQDALVTLVEFSDYECGFCKRVEATLRQLLKDYPEDLRLVWKDRPLGFHRYALPAAAFARSAAKPGPRGSYWAVHDALFEAQPKLAPTDLERLAHKLGQDWTAVERRMQSPSVQAAIREDIALAEKLQINGTPNFFVNGRALRGAVPIERFKALIDQELAKAKRMVAEGTARAQVYTSVMARARASSKP